MLELLRELRLLIEWLNQRIKENERREGEWYKSKADTYSSVKIKVQYILDRYEHPIVRSRYAKGQTLNDNELILYIALRELRDAMYADMTARNLPHEYQDDSALGKAEAIIKKYE
jgi:hypothetical protein